MSNRKREINKRIADLEGEIMIVGFNGTSIEDLKHILLALYAERGAL